MDCYTVQQQISPPAGTTIVCRGDRERTNYRTVATASTYTEAQRLAALAIIGNAR